MTAPLDLSRRAVLAGTGALIVEAHFAGPAAAQAPAQSAAPPAAKPLPGSLKTTPLVDAWVKIGADGTIEILTGKAELGQGITTAIVQVAAEELGLAPGAIKLTMADTGLTADEGMTAGSHSMQDSATAIRLAAATARAILIQRAAAQFGLPPSGFDTQAGAVIAPDGRSVSFAALVQADFLHVLAEADAPLRDPAHYRIVGETWPRLDIPAKITGAEAYVQDIRLPGMLHARVIRQPSPGAMLRGLEGLALKPGTGLIRDGNFIAVTAEREYDAVVAMREAETAARWTETANLPVQSDIYETLLALPAETTIIHASGAPPVSAIKTVESVFHRPYQMHGSIGPSCAVALFKDGSLTVWSHTQGVFPLRKAIAQLAGLEEAKVRCIHIEGAGCYGHNAADDAAGDAAFIAMRMEGHPIRVQWMREQENSCEPFGPAMIARAKASLDEAGRIVDWNYGVWSNTHNNRPGPAGNLLVAQTIAKPFKPAPPKPIPQPEGGGDRNAIPLYKLPNAVVASHFIPAMPVRVSAMRGLGAYLNIFAIESFMDQLAEAAGQDPVAFRLAHLEDARARAVIERAAKEFGWTTPGAGSTQSGEGHGFAFARYKNLGAYAAIALTIQVESETGRIRVKRAVAAVDSGQAVNPGGIRNQIEGGIIQSLSWTLFEHVTYSRQRITSRDWSRYPIMRFSGLPESVDVHVIDRPGAPFLGTGEATQGPTSAALANALFAATGRRVTSLPLRLAERPADTG